MNIVFINDQPLSVHYLAYFMFVLLLIYERQFTSNVKFCIGRNLGLQGLLGILFSVL